MDSLEIEAALASAFLALDDVELGRLVRWAREGRRFLCGKVWFAFIDGKGGS